MHFTGVIQIEVSATSAGIHGALRNGEVFTNCDGDSLNLSG